MNGKIARLRRELAEAEKEAGVPVSDNRAFYLLTREIERRNDLLAAAKAENKRLRELLERAEELLFCARGALSKMGLRDRGSDCGLSHEVRMFALQFSQECREGPGALQVTGTGDLHRWTQDARAALSTPSDTSELDRLVADAGRAKWQPIETAPAEGKFLVYMPDEPEGREIQSALWSKNCKIIGGHFAFDLTIPTHWMPLPDAPDAARAEVKS